MALDDKTPPSAQQASENVEGQSVSTSAAIPAPTSADSSSNKSENSDNNRDFKAEDDVDNDSEDSATEINIRMPMTAPGAPRQPRPQPSMLLRESQGRVQPRTMRQWIDSVMEGSGCHPERELGGKTATAVPVEAFTEHSIRPPPIHIDAATGQPVRTAAVGVNIPRPTPTAASEPVLDRIGEFVHRSNNINSSTVH